jgi:hypothetical protein
MGLSLQEDLAGLSIGLLFAGINNDLPFFIHFRLYIGNWEQVDSALEAGNI